MAELVDSRYPDQTSLNTVYVRMLKHHALSRARYGAEYQLEKEIRTEEMYVFPRIHNNALSTGSPSRRYSLE